MKNTRKILFIIYIISASTVNANPLTVGVQTGFTAAKLHATPQSLFYGTNAKVSAKPGLSAGVTVNIPLFKGLSLEPGLFYVQKGTKAADNYGSAYEYRFRFNYVNVPVLVKYTYKGIFLGIGPHIGIATSTATKIITTDTSYVLKLSVGNDSKKDALARMDGGISFKTGYIAPFGLLAALQYDLGLANVLPKPSGGITARNMAFSISFGYVFGYSIKSRKKEIAP